MQTTIEINAPSVGDTAGINLNVRVANKSCGALYVELNQSSIDYLRAVLTHQVDSGNIHRKRTSVHIDEQVQAPAGLSYSYTRNKLVKTEWVVSPESGKK